MKQLGLKRWLLLSVMLLVGISVSITSYISYLKESSLMTDMITQNSQEYVKSKAQLIESYLNEKVNGVRALGKLYQNQDFPGHSDQDYIALTKVFAGALNTGSSFIGFESNGDAFWNQSNDGWPNHKYKGDIREASYYKDGRKAIEPSMTDPYPDEGDASTYWISIVQKTHSGVLGVDMKLGFLNDIVKKATDIPGSVALILNQDTTVFASSSSAALKSGDKGSDIGWFKDAVLQSVNAESSVVDYTLDGDDKMLFSHRINVAGKRWYFMIGVKKSTVFAPLATAKNIAIIISVLATLLSIVIAFFVIQMLYRPILALKKTIIGLSSGDADLTQRLVVDSTDDLGQIAEGVNRFISNLQNMMREIRSVSGALQENADRLKQQSEQNSTILQSHVSETEHIVTAISEMDSTAASMAADAANTASLTRQANETSTESRKIVEQSQATVSVLIEDVETSSVNVQKMSDDTQGITEILSVIGSIAEQTNLLALNAAIEAARAGDQGRGFAVVADEVRNLASRTKASTEEVETALTRLVQGTQIVVGSMNSTKQQCQETADGSVNVATSLETMTHYVSEINDLSTQIATAAEEQNGVTQELNRNMTALNQIVSELDQNGQEALASAEDIAGMNRRLSEIVNRFKL